MLRPIPVLAAALLLATPALADDTILRLSETAIVMATPDELAASLRAEASAPTAQEVQKRVNDMMRDALTAAKKIDGVTVSTSGYTVWRTAAKGAAETWQAGQAINLNGPDGEAVLRLVGDLQQKGLATSSVGWHLSRKTEKAAREEATKQALSGLRARADSAAASLSMQFESFREIRLDNAGAGMPPRPMNFSRGVMSSTAAPPAAEAEDQPVSVQVEADIVLKGR